MRSGQSFSNHIFIIQFKNPKEYTLFSLPPLTFLSLFPSSWLVLYSPSVYTNVLHPSLAKSPDESLLVAATPWPTFLCTHSLVSVMLIESFYSSNRAISTIPSWHYTYHWRTTFITTVIKRSWYLPISKPDDFNIRYL